MAVYLEGEVSVMRNSSVALCLNCRMNLLELVTLGLSSYIFWQILSLLSTVKELSVLRMTGSSLGLILLRKYRWLPTHSIKQSLYPITVVLWVLVSLSGRIISLSQLKLQVHFTVVQTLLQALEGIIWMPFTTETPMISLQCSTSIRLLQHSSILLSCLSSSSSFSLMAKKLDSFTCCCILRQGFTAAISREVRLLILVFFSRISSSRRFKRYFFSSQSDSTSCCWIMATAQPTTSCTLFTFSTEFSSRLSSMAGENRNRLPRCRLLMPCPISFRYQCRSYSKSSPSLLRLQRQKSSQKSSLSSLQIFLISCSTVSSSQIWGTYTFSLMPSMLQQYTPIGRGSLSRLQQTLNFQLTVCISSRANFSFYWQELNLQFGCRISESVYSILLISARCFSSLWKHSCSLGYCSGSDMPDSYYQKTYSGFRMRCYFYWHFTHPHTRSFLRMSWYSPSNILSFCSRYSGLFLICGTLNRWFSLSSRFTQDFQSSLTVSEQKIPKNPLLAISNQSLILFFLCTIYRIFCKPCWLMNTNWQTLLRCRQNFSTQRVTTALFTACRFTIPQRVTTTLKLQVLASKGYWCNWSLRATPHLSTPHLLLNSSRRLRSGKLTMTALSQLRIPIRLPMVRVQANLQKNVASVILRRQLFSRSWGKLLSCLIMAMQPFSLFFTTKIIICQLPMVHLLLNTTSMPFRWLYSFCKIFTTCESTSLASVSSVSLLVRMNLQILISSWSSLWLRWSRGRCSRYFFMTDSQVVMCLVGTVRYDCRGSLKSSNRTATFYLFFMQISSISAMVAGSPLKQLAQMFRFCRNVLNARTTSSSCLGGFSTISSSLSMKLECRVMKSSSSPNMASTLCSGSPSSFARGIRILRLMILSLTTYSISVSRSWAIICDRRQAGYEYILLARDFLRLETGSQTSGKGSGLDP